MGGAKEAVAPPEATGQEASNWTEVNGKPRASGRENRPANIPGAPAADETGIANGHVLQPPAAMKQQRRRNERPATNGITPEPIICRDMDSLRAQVDLARAGTGDVARIIHNSTFQPREAAFTRLIQACVPSHDWQKALELWEVMRATPELKPNTISYRWKEAESIFAEQLEAAKTDEECKPNRITYSSLLTACTKGNRVDRALHWYEHMTRANIEADFITYSVLIPGCLESDFPLDCALGLMEDMHALGHQTGPETYVRILDRLGKQGQWEKAIEVFLSALMAGADPVVDLSVALLSVFEACSQSLPAAQLLESFSQTFGPPAARLCNAALRVYAKTGCWQRALSLWEGRIKSGKLADGMTARLLLDSLERGGQQARAAELLTEFKAMNLAPAKPPSS